VQLLHRLHDPRERGYRQRLARVEQKDPLQQFLQALDHERAGDYPRAIDHMRRALQLKPDEHRFYAALARLYERAGDIARARSALAGAQSHSRGKVQANYEAERERLRKLQATRD
jgi:Flp pilus assembly protein TadD